MNIKNINRNIMAINSLCSIIRAQAQWFMSLLVYCCFKEERVNRFNAKWCEYVENTQPFSVNLYDRNTIVESARAGAYFQLMCVSGVWMLAHYKGSKTKLYYCRFQKRKYNKLKEYINTIPLKYNRFVSINSSSKNSVSKSPARDWSMVIGNNTVKEKIICTVDWHLNNRDFFLKRKIPYKLVLFLYGEPGVGKTTIIQALATHLNKNIYVKGKTSFQSFF